MPAKRDYYLILGVRPIEFDDQIKAAYKVLIKRWHPDLNKDNKTLADKKMREITEAYNCLSNRQQRKQYDESPPFVYKLPTYLRPEKAHLRTKHIRPPGKPTKNFWEKLKDLMFVKDPEEEEKKRLEHDRKLTKQGVDSFMMGVSCLEKKETSMLELAKAEFESVVRESPEMPEALFNLGLVYYKFGNVQEALKCLNRALRHLPNDKDIRRFIEMISDDQEEVPQG